MDITKRGGGGEIDISGPRKNGSVNRHIQKIRTTKQNLTKNEKYNHKAKMLVLNWHNQNPNISTVLILKVLLQ
jgi:hypothetical protein